MAGIFPGIVDIPVLSLLTNRRAVIIITTLGISYPLSLYRDIAKVGLGIKAGYVGIESLVGSADYICVVKSWQKLVRLHC